MDIVVAMRPRLVEWFFDDEALARLEALGRVTLVGSYADLTSGDAPAALAGAEVLVTGWGTGPVDEAVLDSAPRLAAVVHSAGSVRHLVTPRCWDRGVQVSSQAAANAVPVAEYALAMILLAGKDVFRAQRVYRSRRHPVDQQEVLAGRGNYRTRVGLVGASKIGTRVVELLRPFDLEVVVHDPYLSEERAAALGVRAVGLDELMATSRVVSLHAPMNESTRHMVGAAQLALMPDGATLVNTARPGLVDEAALLAELVSDRIQAVLDVTTLDSDPDSPVWDLPNVVLTPHVAGALGGELRRLGDGVVTDVEALARTGRIPAAITAEAFALLA
ncbi:hydroxyacid dehydrogenase [Auraticoccus monumenti]|uniref:Phosphoglycerate dehydrogenase n=1 Tax=Auraticoccus monumenti TaxID=675864 RepID=A0A1G7AQS3_9ACTN|nr:hydroxyacid dehydrogenase [Auraticoccus monumenti]SDE17050.1 Phosphoglycerate dehydrogenase [Auraticoccus monumenti]